MTWSCGPHYLQAGVAIRTPLSLDNEASAGQGFDFTVVSS